MDLSMQQNPPNFPMVQPNIHPGCIPSTGRSEQHMQQQHMAQQHMQQQQMMPEQMYRTDEVSDLKHDRRSMNTSAWLNVDIDGPMLTAMEQMFKGG